MKHNKSKKLSKKNDMNIDEDYEYFSGEDNEYLKSYLYNTNDSHDVRLSEEQKYYD